VFWRSVASAAELGRVLEKYNRNYWLEDWPGFLEFFFSKCFTEPDSRAEIEHFIGMGLETTPETIIATVEAPALREDEARRLATSLSRPALVIHGDEDAITPLHRGRELARLAGAELSVLAGSGHEPQCRSPLEVNRLVDAFLEEHYPPS
jgi:pimeloyl-ACP methyl ester carboxylesterase